MLVRWRESTESFSVLALESSLINTNPEHNHCEISSLRVIHITEYIQLLCRECSKRHIQCSKAFWRRVLKISWENIFSMFWAWTKSCLFCPNESLFYLSSLTWKMKRKLFFSYLQFHLTFLKAIILFSWGILISRELLLVLQCFLTRCVFITIS